MDIIDQNRPAAFDKSVVFSVDQNFFPYALFAASQIAAAHPNRDFDICILSTEPLQSHQLLDELQIRICVLRQPIELASLDLSKRLSFATYLRILAPQALKNEYRRILYLDADVFYVRGDISRLLDLDFGDRPLAAVRDIQQLKNRSRTPRDLKPFGVKSHKYLNSGVLLIDVENFNNLNLTKEVLAFAASHHGQLIYHDQTALNYVLRGNWAELSLNWNFQYSHKTAFFLGMFDVCLVHFVGRRKPFRGRYSTSPNRFCVPYERFFSKHFPDQVEFVDNGLEATKHGLHLAIVILTHLVTGKKFLANENRWRSDWDVK